MLCGQEASRANPDIGTPKFFLDALSYTSDQVNKSRLDVYVQLLYEVLSFVKVGETYQARYEITVSVYDSSGELVTEKLWNEKVETKDYAESVSRHFGKISRCSFHLKPSVYVLAVQVRDNETKKVSQRRKTVIVREFLESLSFSDMMLVTRTSQEGEKIAVYPNVTGVVDDVKDSFQVFFEVYTKSLADSILLLLNVQGEKGETVWSDSLVFPLLKLKNSMIISVQSDNFSAGDYIVQTKGLLKGKEAGSPSASSIALVTRAFSVRSRGFPITVTDIDLAIEQMQYLNDIKGVERIKKAPPAERKKLFIEYWKKHDPTPNTEYNELMVEYYQRVEFANKNFGHYLAGWKTDRGMVYIIFGAPSNIERYPFNLDAKPYEVWSYYHLNREFVFIDATGLGDYRLQSPIWDKWQTRYR